jgi:membrane dipeptidase
MSRNSRRNSRLLSGALVSLGGAFLLGPILFAQAAPQESEAALVARAKGIHDRVITADTHNDISPNNFTPECNYTMRLTTQVNLPKMEEGGLDVSFMIAYTGQGPLTPEGYENAYKQAVAKFDAVHLLTKELAPNKIGLALTPDDVRKIAASGRKVAVIGIENGYPLGMDIKRVKEFYDRGGRYMSLAHNGHSQLADSNTGEANNIWLHGGLSPLGKQVIAEMNKWGIMVDISHPSKAANLQAIALSKAPVIASHSAARALANHSRNLDDETLWAVKQNGGVVQTVAFASYVRVAGPERQAAINALNQEFGISAGGGGGGGGRGGGGGGGRGGAGAAGAAGSGAAAGGAAAGAGGATAGGGAAGGRAGAAGAAGTGGAQGGGGRGGGAGGCSVEQPGAAGQGGGRGGGRGGAGGGANPALDALTPDRRAQYDLRMMSINAKYPVPARANVKDFVDHIDYLVKYIGLDHVGISSDFDGGGGVDGWNSAAETFNVTLELVRRGYTEEQIGKIWSGNLLRVWAEVEKVAKGIQAGTIK